MDERAHDRAAPQTGSAERADNMWVFARAALEELQRALDAAPR